MKQRRLVVISYHYPPDGAIGGMRWAGLTKYLAPLGWKSWIITAAPGAAGGDGAELISCPRREIFNDHYRRFRLRNGAVPFSESGAAANSLLTRIRLELGMLFSLPDAGRGWVMRAAVKARRLIDEVSPDVVVSTGPPHSAHLVAWLATRGKATRWLVDMRDPWAGPKTTAWLATPTEQSALARFVSNRLERLVFGAASGALCNTRQFADVMRERYPGVPVHWIPNAVDHELLPSLAATAPFPGLSLAYAGTLYGGRNLRPVLQALRLFLDRHPQTNGNRCTLRIAGHMDATHQAALRREIGEFGLEAYVELLGVMSRDQALELAARSRLGIVLAQDQELQVPAKLYELAAMRIPTVVISTPSGAAWSEAERLGALSVDPTNAEGLVGVMEKLCNGHPPARPTEGVDYRDLAACVNELLAAPVPE